MKYKNIPPQIAAKLNESVGRVRRILLVRGTCATLAVFVASVLSIMAIDAMVTIYVSWVRWLLWACCVAATAAVAWFALIKPLRRKFTAAEIAALIERNHPELEERLSTVVELAQAGDLSSSSRLMEEITKDAVKDVQTVSPKKEFTGRTVKPRFIAAAIAVGILLLLFAVFPDATLRLATRALAGRLGAPWVYASVGGLDEGIGHVTPAELVRDYRFRSVTKDAAGNITIKGTAKFFRHTSLIANNGQKALMKATDNDGSYMKYEIEIKISAQDMNKFAEADWSQCNTAEATRLEQDDHLVDRFQQAADTIHDNYKFSGTVSATFKGRINALYDLQTIYERNNPNQVPA